MQYIGRGVALRVIRNSEQCGGFEEVQPVDQNLQYDFNFQQFTILPNEVTIYPVSNKRAISPQWLSLAAWLCSTSKGRYFAGGMHIQYLRER